MLLQTTFVANEFPAFGVRLVVYTGTLLKWIGYGAGLGSLFFFAKGESAYMWLSIIYSFSAGLYRCAHWLGGDPLVPSSIFSLFDKEREPHQSWLHQKLVWLVDRYQPGVRSQAEQMLMNLTVGRKRLEAMGGDSVALTTADGAVIDGMYFAPTEESVQDKEPCSMVVLRANGEFYELDGFGGAKSDGYNYSRKGFHVILINYRGVGRSDLGGWASRMGLTLDADAAVQFSMQVLKVPLHRTFFMTRSLGGAVGTEVASYRPEINLCNNRSFNTFSNAAEGVIGEQFGKYAAKAVSYLFWDYDSVSNWKRIKGYKWIEYIENDTMLCNKSLLVRSLVEDKTVDKKSLNVLKMAPTRGDTHNRPMTSAEESARWKFFQKAFTFMDKSSESKKSR